MIPIVHSDFAIIATSIKIFFRMIFHEEIPSFFPIYTEK